MSSSFEIQILRVSTNYLLLVVIYLCCVLCRGVLWGSSVSFWTPRVHGVSDPRAHGVVFFLWTHRAHGADLARAHGVLWAEMSTRPSTLYLSFFALELLMILCIFVIYPRVLIPNTICILLQLVFPHVVEPYDHLLLGLCFNLPYLTACAIFYLLE